MPAIPPALLRSLQDHYAIDRELGHGSMATVYLARDRKYDRQVALKVLRPELAAVLGRERFLAEIRVTAKLDHPHILTLINSGESDGFLWYVLPYIRGESLRQKLDRERQLDIMEALAIARGVAGALNHAHGQGVIHRDVKPENILLHEGEPMLADFGIALAVREAAGERLTETGLSVGTPQYMSPEQASGERQLDARSDVYSLGAVLYEMLAGEPPFTGATGQAVIAKLMTQPPTPVRTIRPTVPGGIDAAVARALAKVPADRFRSTGEFVAALDAQVMPVPGPKLRLPTLLIITALLGLLAAGVWLAPHLRSRPRAEPTLTQLTFSGHAEAPALSPDATQLAYFEKNCRSLTDCRYSVVVQDVGSAERRTLADGYTNHYQHIVWSADQRFLLFSATRDTTAGDFLLSMLGGREQYLGCCRSTFLGASDTVIQSPPANQAPDTSTIDRWFLLLTLGGLRVDSIRVRLPGGNALWPLPAPDGRHLVIWSYAGENAQRYYLATRKGTITDTIPFLNGSHGLFVQWTSAGDSVLMLVAPESTAPALRTLLRFRVSDDGRVRLPPDTIATRLRLSGLGPLTPPSRAGDFALQLGEPSFAVWTLLRRSPTAPPVLGSKLLSATAPVTPIISPDGNQVAVVRPVVLDGAAATQVEVWPFDGGIGAPLGTPLAGLRGLDWSSDGRSLYWLILRSGGHGLLDLASIDLATGRTRQVLTRPDTLRELQLLRDGLLVYKSHGGVALPAEWRSLTKGDSAPQVFTFPDSTTFIEAVTFQPGLRGSYVVAVSAGVDSVWRKTGKVTHAIYLAPSEERARLVTQFEAGPGNNVDILHVGPGALIEMAVRLGATVYWFHLEPGRPPRNLGALPVRNIPNLFSDDGSRGVVVETETHTDAWVLKWPRE